jgi:addiction module HigA family antidote
MRKRDLPPIHPGEQLREEFMLPLSLSAYRLAKEIGVPVSRIQAITTEKRSISGDTALRLARYFETTPEFWLNLQRDYDLEMAELAAGDEIEARITPRAA